MSDAPERIWASPEHPSQEGRRAMNNELGSFYLLVDLAISEGSRAMIRFPQPNYVITKFAEEAGEVVKAAVHCAENRESYDNLRLEMVQAIAMLFRLWVEGDRVHGLLPVETQLTQKDAKP